MKKVTLITCLIAIVFIGLATNVYSENIAYRAHITHVLINSNGVMIIQIDQPTNSAGGYLQIDGSLSDPIVKAMYATALAGQITGKICTMMTEVRGYPYSDKILDIQITNEDQ